MKKTVKIFILLLFILSLSSKVYAVYVSDHKIAVLVNDQLITSYDIFQRMKMNAILSGIDITIENNDQITNSAVKELIQEKLKYEKLMEYNISVSNDEYLQQENNFFNNAPFSKDKILKIFEINNIKYDEFENFLISQISWQKLISSMYYRMTSTSEIEVEEIILNNPNITKDKAREIIIQRQLDLKSTKMIRDMFDEATIEYK
ncbi:SurA N-terminal domain-containing protein [Pelagibacterales bacterium SAG-MED32]|mgnify:CR=1 FL=1|nr:SurA N-terminal domain-containing protein [Pelagibacterales bacterium SAG-MED32]|tara:strand:+ start:2522 stop:3133 length:612 start_codon:yes stop_codon:yes gene_type:complete